MILPDYLLYINIVSYLQVQTCFYLNQTGHKKSTMDKLMLTGTQRICNSAVVLVKGEGHNYKEVLKFRYNKMWDVEYIDVTLVLDGHERELSYMDIVI